MYTQDKSFNITTGADRFKWLLNNKQICKNGSPSGVLSVRIHSLVFINSFKWTEWAD